MAIETGSLARNLEAGIHPKPHCLFLSGGMGTYAGIRGIEEGLKRQYGMGNVDVFNSVFSKDSQNPKRFEQMADIIQKYAGNGLDIVAHSLGAVELRKAIEVIKKRDQAFFDKEKNTENLHIVLIGASGFAKNAFTFLRRTIRYSREQADLRKISKSNTLFRGIDALTVFPPQDVSPQDLANALREAMPELSHYERDVATFPLEKEENYFDSLSADQKEHVKTYSEMIRSAIEDRNYSGLRLLVKKYGEKLRKPLFKIYAGGFESMPAPILEKTRATIGGYIGLLNVLIDSFGSKPMKEIARLKAKGIRVDFLVPEYDIFVPLDEAIAFFEGEEGALNNIKVAEGVAHAFPALQKMRFGEMIRDLRGDKVS